MSDVATALRLHSATELLVRTEQAGLLRRQADPDDRRRTLCTLTAEGSRVLAALSEQHRRELRQIRAVVAARDRLDPAPEAS